MSLQIFISYKSEYREFAREVKSRIHAWGYKSWLDVDEIPDGSYFRFEIDKGLKTSDVVVGVITQEAQESREVLFELDFAIKKNKPLLPLKYRECELMYHLESIQWIDFTRDSEAGFERLHNRLMELAERPATPAPPAEPLRDSTLIPPLPSPAPSLQEQQSSTQHTYIPSDVLNQPLASRKAGGGLLVGILLLPFVVIAGLFTFVRDRLRSSGRDEAELARRNRAVMLQKVHDFWVVGVLENALKESGAFDLGLSAAPGAVLKHLDYGDYALPSSANIASVFDDLHHELMILGAPGAGKTILLLQLARALIENAKIEPPRRRESGEEEPMPVVFNLSSWAAERKPLAEWLVDELRLKYQVPKKVAQGWVESEALTLLLDGLDEVAEDYRNACVEAINAFRQKYGKTDLAVCSRIADYEMLTSRLDLRGGITLQPLSPEQVNAYIDRPELAALREALRTDATLQEMAGTPFLLNTMAYAYRDATPMSLKVAADGDAVKARRTHLFDSYVEKRLALTPAPSPSRRGGLYTPAQTRHYLAWLAGKMVEFRQSVFYIEGLQPGWLGTPQQKSRYRLMVILAFGLMVALWFGLGIGVAKGLAVFVAFGLVVALAQVLVLGLGDVKIADRLRWRYSWRGLVFGPVGWLETEESVATRSYPNQGIYRSRRNAIEGGLLVGLPFGLLVGLALGQMTGLADGLPLGLFAGLGLGLPAAGQIGGAAVIKHGILRLFLARSGAAPLNYARFLDYAASVQLLRQVAGGYIFVHRYLLEYFAELEV